MNGDYDICDLPPVGTISEDIDQHGAAVQFLTQLVEEGKTGREEWVGLADSCMTIYLHGEDPVPPDHKVVVNEIQNAIIAATDIQTKEPPTITLEPVETGEPGVCFWAGTMEEGMQAAALLGLQLLPEQLGEWADEMGQPRPPLPLSRREGDAVKQLVMTGKIPEKWMVEVDDALVAECYQSVFDVFWMRSQADLWVRQNLLDNNIQGWAWGLYEWDDDRQRHELKHLSIRQVYADPTVRDIAEMCYLVLDIAIDHNQAKRLWPHLADKLKEFAHVGQPEGIDGNDEYGGEWQGRDFKRKINELRIAWLRNQPCPYTAEEALELGLISEVVNEPSIPGIGAGAGGVQQGDGVALQGNMAAGEGEAGLLRDEHDGDDAAGGVRPDGAIGSDLGEIRGRANGEISYVLTETGEPTAEGQDNWPSRPCLRQITTIAGAVIDDRECEHYDIPILHNVNIPIPHRPWGMGEPWRLRNIQAAHSRIINSMVEHSDFFRAPLVTMSKTMADLMTEAYGDAYVKAGRTIIIPDDLYQLMGGKCDNIVNPPPTPPALVELQPILRQMISEVSGNADVLQGRAQPQIKSGKAIEHLQSAATSQIGFKSQRTGDMVARLGHLMLHSLVWRLEAEEVGRIVSRFEPHILSAIHERARKMEWDVKVVVSSGNGSLLAQKKQEAIEMFAVRDPVTGESAMTMETLRESLGLDHRQEQQRHEGAIQRSMRVAAMGAPQAGAPGQENQENGKEESHNGNGRFQDEG